MHSTPSRPISTSSSSSTSTHVTFANEVTDDVHALYITEIYPEAYIPCNSASSSAFNSANSSPFGSPLLLPRQTSTLNPENYFDHKDMFVLPPPPARIIRKPSQTMVSRRNSVLLDPILEEDVGVADSGAFPKGFEQRRRRNEK
ncbi:12868_t:CDS:1 [Ambispora gerdemannii]|uniref:12868_t:CDS:1 n=1 Tax=Ambispora gerdemannii TaxID=144530 RepID=A0A9N9F9R4_9GLOM|nr:12868_t:CDS:1 [Ambispora gerdemannii]